MKDKTKDHSTMDRPSWNNIVNRRRLPLLSEKSGAIALALPGLTAGRLADKIVLN